MSDHAPPRRLEQGVKAADSAFRILEAVAFARSPISLTEIARQLAMSKAGVFRYLKTLVERGYIVQGRDTARYRLGPKAYAISHLAPVGGDLIDAAEGPMRNLLETTGLSTVLGAPAPEGVVVMHAFAGIRGLGLQVWPGQILRPLYAGAHGKLVLVYGPKEYRARTFAAPLEARTPKTIIDHDQLRQELERVERVGYAVAAEEYTPGVGTVAAPIFGPDHELVGTLALVSLIQDIPAEPDPGLIQAVVRAAREITDFVHNAAGSSTSRNRTENRPPG
jgi:IclR family transcriptional regulator, KDG regulon repressor